MPNSKIQRRGQEEKNPRGKLPERASSFHGRSSGSIGEQLIRPRTVPDLLSGRRVVGFAPEGRPKLTKLLVNVTVERSVGAVQVVISPESSVGDLIAATLRQYAKESRRPILSSSDPSGFDLHYSQFSLESLDPEGNLRALGSRNFFLCTRKSAPATGSGSVATPSSSCSKQAEKEAKIGIPWLKFSLF